MLVDKVSTVHVRASAFVSNDAYEGGGIHVQAKATLFMGNHSTVLHNQATVGAGISSIEKSHLYARDSLFQNNTALSRGGGIMMTHSNCPVDAKDAMALTALTAPAAGPDASATVHYEACTLIDSCTFERNVAGAGGGFFWRYRENANGNEFFGPESRDFQCHNCVFEENQPTGQGTNAMGTRILYYPSQEVETGEQLIGEGKTIEIEVTDRFGARSTLDDTTVCSITKDPTEKGDLGIDEGSTQSAKGVVSFNGIRFLGDGDTTYHIQLSCLIDNVIDIAYDKLITIGWCEEGYAPIARICRPCQDRMYSLHGQSCLDCPDGGNCTALTRSNDGLPRGVGEPRALPGYWLYTAPKAAARNRCPTGWLDNQGPCNPAEVLMPKSGVCVDRNWPTFQVHMCLTNVIFYRCPRGESSCPGNHSMSEVALGTNYTYTEIDPQCNVGYGNVICGNCLLGYYAAVADQCTKCLNTKGEEVQTKMFYGGLMAMMMMLLNLFIFFYLHDGIIVGKKWQPRTGDLNCCQKCTQRCGDGVRQSMSQGFQIEKFKIALGLFQVFSSFKMTYEINWPPEVMEWFDQFAIFENLDILKLVAMDCLFKTDYLFSLKFQTLSPLVLVTAVYYLWTNSKKVYAKKLALYPRVCSGCNMPIHPFEKNTRDRLMHAWVSKQKSFCTRTKLYLIICVRKKLFLKDIVITKEMFHSAGMGMFDGLPEKTEPKKQKKKKKKKNNNLTAVIPVIDVIDVEESEESKDERQLSKQSAAKTAWSKETKPPKKKRNKPVLRRKTSLENNFSDNSMVHKYGCPMDQQHNIHYKPNHKEHRLFNFKMRGGLWVAVIVVLIVVAL